VLLLDRRDGLRAVGVLADHLDVFFLIQSPMMRSRAIGSSSTTTVRILVTQHPPRPGPLPSLLASSAIGMAMQTSSPPSAAAGIQTGAATRTDDRVATGYSTGPRRGEVSQPGRRQPDAVVVYLDAWVEGRVDHGGGRGGQDKVVCGSSATG
jgi:hypothetical protein